MLFRSVVFGNPEVTPGGRALKFYSTIRMEVRRADSIKFGGEMIGTRVRVKVVKNKLAAPFRQAEFDIIFGKGISREGDILDLAVNAGLVKKSGTWFSYEDTRLGQGRENARKFLEENSEVIGELEAKLRESHGGFMLPTKLEFEEEPAVKEEELELKLES